MERPRFLVKTKLVVASIKSYSEEVIKVGINVSKRFIGIPISFMNETTTNVEFKGSGMPSVVDNVDNDSDLEGFVTQNYRISYEYDIVQKIIVYFEIMDLFTELGGLNSAAGAIVSSYAVWFTIKYFWDLAEVIKGKRQNDCKKALIVI